MTSGSKSNNYLIFLTNELHLELLSHDDLQKKLFSFIVFGMREPADLIDKQK